MSDTKKPPVGLRPKYIWERERILEIFDAMRRYSTEEMPIPSEWIDELATLIGIFNPPANQTNWEKIVKDIVRDDRVSFICMIYYDYDKLDSCECCPLKEKCENRIATEQWLDREMVEPEREVNENG